MSAEEAMLAATQARWEDHRCPADGCDARIGVGCWWCDDCEQIGRATSAWDAIDRAMAEAGWPKVTPNTTGPNR